MSKISRLESKKKLLLARRSKYSVHKLPRFHKNSNSFGYLPQSMNPLLNNMSMDAIKYIANRSFNNYKSSSKGFSDYAVSVKNYGMFFQKELRGMKDHKKSFPSIFASIKPSRLHTSEGPTEKNPLKHFLQSGKPHKLSQEVMEEQIMKTWVKIALKPKNDVYKSLMKQKE